MKYILLALGCLSAEALQITKKHYPSHLHGMPLLEFVMTHDESEQDTIMLSTGTSQQERDQDIENLHFNYYTNEKEHWNFSKYPTQQLDGVAEANLDQIQMLNQATKFKMEEDPLNDGDKEPKEDVNAWGN